MTNFETRSSKVLMHERSDIVTFIPPFISYDLDWCIPSSSVINLYFKLQNILLFGPCPPPPPRVSITGGMLSPSVGMSRLSGCSVLSGYSFRKLLQHKLVPARCLYRFGRRAMLKTAWVCCQEARAARPPSDETRQAPSPCVWPGLDGRIDVRHRWMGKSTAKIHVANNQWITSPVHGTPSSMMYRGSVHAFISNHCQF